MDPALFQVIDILLPDSELQPYKSHRTELSIHDGCILCGAQVSCTTRRMREDGWRAARKSPRDLQDERLSKIYVWWPGIDQGESLWSLSALLQQSRPLDHPVMIQLWEWPKRPWARIYLDYAGPLFGKMFWLILKVSNHSNHKCHSPTPVIDFLGPWSVRCDVTDSGTGFTSAEFQDFTREMVFVIFKQPCIIQPRMVKLNGLLKLSRRAWRRVRKTHCRHNCPFFTTAWLHARPLEYLQRNYYSGDALIRIRI